MPDSLFSSASIDGSSVLLVSSAWVDGPSSSLTIIPSSRLKPSVLSIAILLLLFRDDSSCADDVILKFSDLSAANRSDGSSRADNATLEISDPPIAILLFPDRTESSRTDDPMLKVSNDSIKLLLFAVLDDISGADKVTLETSDLSISILLSTVRDDRSCADDMTLNVSDLSIAILLSIIRDDSSCAGVISGL